MDDLISRQELLKRTIYNPLHVLYISSQDVLDCPSAQKKGHWRNYEGTLTCSVCEAEFDNGIMEYCGDDVPMFCPNCGADMRGEEDR